MSTNSVYTSISVSAILPDCAKFDQATLTYELDIDRFFQNVVRAHSLVSLMLIHVFQIPKAFRRKIIHPYSQPFYHITSFSMPPGTGWTRPYILGYGKNKVLCWKCKEGGVYLQTYPSNSYMSSIVKSIKAKIVVRVKTWHFWTGDANFFNFDFSCRAFTLVKTKY